MIYVLLFWTQFSGPAMTSVEFGNKEACERAGSAFEARLKDGAGAPVVKWVCQPKS